MIGFQNELQGDKPDSEEGLDTKSLDKKDLYDLLAHKYYLPPYSSKGVNRDYLLGVYRDQFFRVELMAFKHFEVDLTPQMVRRIGVINNAILVRKLKILLASKGMKELGFDEDEPPEQVILFYLGLAL